MTGTRTDTSRADAVRRALELLGQGRAAEAERELTALAGAPWGMEPDDVRLRVHVLDGLGRARFALRDPEGGIAALRMAVDCLTVAGASADGHAPQAPPEFSSSPFFAGAASPAPGRDDLLPLRCRALQNLCFALSETGAVEESAAVGGEAARLAEALFGSRSPELAGALLRLSAAAYRGRDLAAAEALIRRAMSIWQAQPGPVPEQVGTCLNNLGRIHEERGDRAAGIAFHRQAVEFRRTLPRREDLAFSLGNLGVALAQDGQWREACAALEEALELYASLGGEDDPDARGYAANLAVCRRALNADTNSGETHE
ncbi:MAG: tetratricopeptide repeat protein [Desulfovibrionaceae bacterium]|nr:tetratricopeptide repeat protein [Desulfovibrionaceae bacterium]